MTIFTVDSDNHITAFGSPEEAAAATVTPFDSFRTEKELAELISQWPAERLAATWNSLPGVEPVQGFKSSKTAASRIWKRLQRLGEAAKPKSDKKPKRGEKGAKVAPAKGKATKKASAAKSAPKAKKAAKAEEAAGPREGSKTAQVVAMLQRKNGATLEEIMDKMGWQKHTVRGLLLVLFPPSFP